MISKELENKQKEYYKLYDRFVKADNWFKTQDNDYFESIEGKKEYRAFKEIINKLNTLYKYLKRQIYNLSIEVFLHKNI